MACRSNGRSPRTLWETAVRFRVGPRRLDRKRCRPQDIPVAQLRGSLIRDHSAGIESSSGVTLARPVTGTTHQCGSNPDTVPVQTSRYDGRTTRQEPSGRLDLGCKCPSQLIDKRPSQDRDFGTSRRWDSGSEHLCAEIIGRSPKRWLREATRLGTQRPWAFTATGT